MHQTEESVGSSLVNFQGPRPSSGSMLLMCWGPFPTRDLLSQPGRKNPLSLAAENTETSLIEYVLIKRCLTCMGDALLFWPSRQLGVKLWVNTFLTPITGTRREAQPLIRTAAGGKGCWWIPGKMAWSPAVLSLFLQIKTQGNLEGKKLHLVSVHLPEEGAFQPACARRRQVGDAVGVCALTSQVEVRKQSPEIGGSLPRDSRSGWSWAPGGRSWPGLSHDISLLTSQMAQRDKGEWHGRKVWESHRCRGREFVLVE